MKINIALRALLAAFGTASSADARVRSFLRDPRSVVAKEVRRNAMGEHVLSSILDTKVCDDGGNCATCGERMAIVESKFQVSSAEEAKSLACSVVSKEFPQCLGCYAYDCMDY